MTHGRADTFPHISKAMCFITRDQVCAAGEAVITLFRDHGNRADRKRARIKYLVADWGVDKFREILATYLPFPLVMPKDVEVSGIDLHLGWNPQGDGKFWYGLSVENGRIKDDGHFRLRTAIRTIVEVLGCEVRLSAMQDILFANWTNPLRKRSFKSSKPAVCCCPNSAAPCAS